MELTGRRLWALRRKVAQPQYPIDEQLVAAAAKHETADSVYAQIQNPAAHLIYRYLTEFVVAALEAQTGKAIAELQILDWGGGKGYVSYFLKQQGARVTLYETGTFSHRALWKEFKLAVQTSASDHLRFQDKQFDAVIGFGVLEHVPYDYEWLKEVNRVLKDEGLFFCFNLPNHTGYMHQVAWWRGVRYHDRLYSRPEVRQLLKRAGFNLVGQPWFRQLLPKNYIRYRWPRLWERLDLLATTYTPLGYLAASIEFVARKQHTYLAEH